MSKQGLVCLHITKTAGGTLKRALQDAKDFNVEFVYNAGDKAALKDKNLDGVDLLYGHAIFGVHEEVGYGNNPRYMCFMRHPMTRTISHYFHLRNVDKGPVGDKIRTSSDINEFFANDRHWEFGNFMTRIISGEGHARDMDEDELLAKAKANLDKHFDFVGFQEYFSLSIRKLSGVIGRSLEFEKDVNVGRYDLSKVTEETLQLIDKSTTRDVELYKYAVQKYL